MSPNLRAMAAASVRPPAPSLPRMFETCTPAVLFADEERLGDLPVGSPGRDERQHFALPGRQPEPDGLGTLRRGRWRSGLEVNSAPDGQRLDPVPERYGPYCDGDRVGFAEEQPSGNPGSSRAEDDLGLTPQGIRPGGSHPEALPRLRGSRPEPRIRRPVETRGLRLAQRQVAIRQRDEGGQALEDLSVQGPHPTKVGVAPFPQLQRLVAHVAGARQSGQICLGPEPEPVQRPEPADLSWDDHGQPRERREPVLDGAPRIARLVLPDAVLGAQLGERSEPLRVHGVPEGPGDHLQAASSGAEGTPPDLEGRQPLIDEELGVAGKPVSAESPQQRIGLCPATEPIQGDRPLTERTRAIEASQAMALVVVKGLHREPRGLVVQPGCVVEIDDVGVRARDIVDVSDVASDVPCLLQLSRPPRRSPR